MDFRKSPTWRRIGQAVYFMETRRFRTFSCVFVRFHTAEVKERSWGARLALRKRGRDNGGSKPMVDGNGQLGELTDGRPVASRLMGAAVSAGEPI